MMLCGTPYLNINTDETDGGASIKILDRLGFDPLSELVDCHQYMGEAAPASS